MVSISSLKNTISLCYLENHYGKYFSDKLDSGNRFKFIIEFIGPPGVGKTTYYKFLLKRLKVKYSYIEARDIKALLYTYVRNNIRFSDIHDRLFKDIMKYMALDIEPLESKLKKTNFELKEIECDALSAQFNGLVINDEGICHHFADLLAKYLHCYKDDNSIMHFFKNRLIIYLHAPKEIILDRIKERNRTQNHIWNHHKGLSDDDIMDLTEADLKVKYEFYKELKELGSNAIVSIDSQYNIFDNLNIIFNFIRSNYQINL